MARRITISLPHNLTEEQVRSRLTSGMSDLRRKHPQMMSSAKETWCGDRMDFSVSLMGQSVTGDVQIAPGMVHLHVNLPFLLAMLADRIKPQIEAEGRKLLEAPPESSTNV